ncbi:MAG: bifunctional hydroxymethylpyrimidine kinase/phosphomethylpyrimidine kinase [Slackia sp.]|nr:bifunctional hydroxymethylpyrimidine kinase/phosphomethylpyrimidine kinase [Slackia sp.]
MSYSVASVLSIAGSDSSGGAGIQADIKTIQAHGLFAQTAITALTAQNTEGVYGVETPTPEFVGAQIDAVFADIRPQAVKVGMIASADIASVVVDRLAHHGASRVVVDPVMVSTSGARLIDRDAREVLADRLFPLAAVVTPNMPEAEALCGFEVRDTASMRRAALRLHEETGAAVLVKGGHASGASADDVLCVDGDVVSIEGRRIATENTHGTGCTLSSAIACGLAQGDDVLEAVRAAKRYVAQALAAGFDMGRGCGPLDHDYARRRP